MNTKYQLILIGDISPLRGKIIQTFIQRVQELGIKKDAFNILDVTNFQALYTGNSPTVCVYFGCASPWKDLAILERVIQDAGFVIPAVDDLQNFGSLVPPQLLQVNGFSLSSASQIEALVARVLECLSLLRESRRLFISYKRIESRAAAIQLYEFLDSRGFDVFLDTHSIRPGDYFQEELWHRLVDTDVVVLLDTPGFLGSRWTKEELAKASSMSIGVLQLIWPEHTQVPYSKLCHPIYLSKDNFVDDDFSSEFSSLKEAILNNIGSEVESLRARSLASRQDNLIEEFTAAAKTINKTAFLQPQKFITLNKSNGSAAIVIPTVGVPHAFTYNEKEELIKSIHNGAIPELYLLYDHRNIRDKWLKHLGWLDTHLPIKTVRVVEINSWLNRI